MLLNFLIYSYSTGMSSNSQIIEILSSCSEMLDIFPDHCFNEKLGNCACKLFRFFCWFFERQIRSRQGITLFHITVSNCDSSPSFRDPEWWCVKLFLEPISNSKYCTFFFYLSRQRNSNIFFLYPLHRHIYLSTENDQEDIHGPVSICAAYNLVLLYYYL